MTFLAVFLLSLFITILFSFSYKGKGSSMVPLVIFFAILLLSGLSSQIWIRHSGPVIWGISWIPLLFIILIVTFLFVAPAPYQGKPSKIDKQAEETTEVAISVFVWILLSLLLVSILIGLFFPPPTDNKLF